MHFFGDLMLNRRHFLGTGMAGISALAFLLSGRKTPPNLVFRPCPLWVLGA
jgi:hypothetical protein